MFRGNILLAAFLWLVIAFLVIYPLSILVQESFKISGTDAWGIANYLEFFKDGYYLKTFGNTLLLSTLLLLTTTVFGVPLAYILARYRHRGKTVFTALILLPIVLRDSNRMDLEEIHAIVHRHRTAPLGELPQAAALERLKRLPTVALQLVSYLTRSSPRFYERYFGTDYASAAGAFDMEGIDQQVE